MYGWRSVVSEYRNRRNVEKVEKRSHRSLVRCRSLVSKEPEIAETWRLWRLEPDAPRWIRDECWGELRCRRALPTTRVRVRWLHNCEAIQTQTPGVFPWTWRVHVRRAELLVGTRHPVVSTEKAQMCLRCSWDVLENFEVRGRNIINRVGTRVQVLL